MTGNGEAAALLWLVGEELATRRDVHWRVWTAIETVHSRGKVQFEVHDLGQELTVEIAIEETTMDQVAGNGDWFKYFVVNRLEAALDSHHDKVS